MASVLAVSVADCSDRDARTRKLSRYISEAIRKVDEGTSRSKTVLDLFIVSLEIQRQKLRENCERLIFADPLLYGRKAQELLWRKGYYETVSAAKRLRLGSKTYDELILAHINAGIGHYHHIISKIQIEMNVDMTEMIDYPMVNLDDAPEELKNNKNIELLNWAKSSIQTCLVYLGDLSRYKTEYEESGDDSMPVRYYLQAAGIDLKNGMPYNQLGTLYTGKNYYLDSVRYYIVCLSCESPFDGAEGNLMRILDKNNKYLEISSSKELEVIDQQESVKNLICKFLSLIECCFFDKNASNFNNLCTAALYDLKECLPFRSTCSAELKLCHDDYFKYLQQQEISPDYLSPKILHKFVTISLFCTNKFIKENSSKMLPMKAFILAVLSQLLQKMLNDLIDIGFQVQSPEEIIQERKEKMKNYRNMKNIFKEDLKNTPDAKENHLELDNQAEIVNDKDESIIETSIDDENDLKEPADVTEPLVENIYENIQINKDIENEKISKAKMKKMSQKLRRRRRRHSSLDSSDDSASAESTDCSDLDDKSANDSDSDNENMSEASYFSYTSSEDDQDEDIANHKDASSEKPNSHTSSENENGFAYLSKSKDRNNSSDETGVEENNDLDGKQKDKDESVKEKIFSEELFNEFLDNDNIMIAINMLFNWLHSEEDFIISCRSTGQALFQTLVDILNIVNRQIFPRLSKNIYNVNQQYNSILYQFHAVILGLKYKYKSIPLPEDYDVKSIELSQDGLRDIKWDANKYTNFSLRESNAIRLLRMIDFGVFVVRLKFGIIFNRRLKMYTFKRSKLVNKRGLALPNKYIKEPRPIRPKIVKPLEQNTIGSVSQTEGLQRNMGKLWLTAQVKELESEVRAGRNQRGLPAYVVVDAEALSKHTYLVKRLVSSKRLIVLIPTIVLQLMDEMKKESGGARSAIRWLEFQLRSGSRFLRTQRSSENVPVPCVKFPKKMQRDMHNFVQIIEFCHYFISQEGNDSIADGHSPNLNGTDESGNGSSTNDEKSDSLKISLKEADSSNILVLLTGSKQLELPEQSDFSYVGLAKSAGVIVENIQDFCMKMKNLFGKGGKNR